MTSPTGFSSPRTGDTYKFDITRLGHLLIVRPEEFMPNFDTVHGPQDAMRIDVVDLNEQDHTGDWGVVYSGALWFGRLLVPGLKRQIGELVLGRVAQGIAKGSQDPPWVLADANGEAGAVAFAHAWLQRHPEFKNGAAPTVAPTPAPPPAQQQYQPPPTQQQYQPAQPYQPPYNPAASGPPMGTYGPPQTYPTVTQPPPVVTSFQSGPAPVAPPVPQSAPAGTQYDMSAYNSLSAEQKAALAALGAVPVEGQR